MEVGEIISILRKKKGLSQRELATCLGVSSGAVGMWETNKRQPDLEMIVKISNYFGVTTDYLLSNHVVDRTNSFSFFPEETSKDSSKRNQTLSVERENLLLYYDKYPSEIMELLHSFCSLDKKERTIVLGKCFELEREQHNNVAELKEAK